MTRGASGVEEAAVRAVLVEYAAAASAGDFERWLALWDEEGAQFPPHEAMHRGRAAVREANADFFRNRECSCVIECEEAVAAGTWGFASGTYRLAFEQRGGGETGRIDGKFLAILRTQADGSWKIYRDCFNSNLPLR